MGVSVEGKKVGLILGDQGGYLYQHYNQYDSDRDGVVSPDEAKGIPDQAYLWLLNDVHRDETFPRENGHRDLIREIPPERFVHLMAIGLHNSRPLDRRVLGDYLNYREISGDPLSVAASLISKAVGGDYEAPLGTRVADSILINSGMEVFAWKEVFKRMLNQKQNLEYVASCVGFNYRHFSLERLHQDQNQDGVLTPSEMSGPLNVEDVPGMREIFFSALTNEAREIPAHVALHHMALKDRTLLFGVTLAFFADMASLSSEEIKKHSAFVHLSRFVSSQMLYDPSQFLLMTAFLSSSAESPEQISVFREFLGKLLSEEAKERAAQKFGGDLQTVPTAPNKSEPSPKAGGAFTVEGAVTITPSNFEQEVRYSKKPVLLMIGAGWCPVCHQAKPTVEKVAQEQGSSLLKVAVLDSEAYPELTQTVTNVDGIPQFFYVESGSIKGRLVGFEVEGFHQWLRQLIGGQDI